MGRERRLRARAETVRKWRSQGCNKERIGGKGKSKGEGDRVKRGERGRGRGER